MINIISLFPINFTHLERQINLKLHILFLLLISMHVDAEPLVNNVDEKITISIAAIDWCPQICYQDIEKGYVVELVEEVFKGTRYQLNIEIYPWSRAIKLVTEGKADALLSPAKAEAPQLLFPENSVGKQQMCFFTSKNSKWTYSGVSSLKDKLIGIATDTSIEELNEYAELNPQQFQYQPYHERYIIQNAHKLDKQRFDTFLFTKNSTVYELKRLNKWHNYRIAGCVSQAKIYMAFSPLKSANKNIEKLMNVFDQQMVELNKTGFMSALMKKYGLLDKLGK